MAKRPVQDQSVCRNRKADFRFEIIEKIECGIVLRGSEIKSLRERAASIEEAFARIENNEAWLIGCHIAPYSHANTANHEPLRRRKLLLHRQEIRKLLPKVEQKGLTLVPLRVYFNERGIAKVTLGLARGKTASDKRQSLKEREDRREIERSLKRR
jgi:SsrA-binding protein